MQKIRNLSWLRRFPKTVLSVALILWVAAGCNRKGATSSKPEGRPVTRSHDPAKQKEERFRWNVETLGEAYDRVGSRNKKWNDEVRKGMAELARYRGDMGGKAEKAAGFFDRAVARGCDDPLVIYWSLRFGTNFESLDAKALATTFESTAQRLSSSGYHPVRKFFGAVRAAATVQWAGLDWKRVYPLRQMAADYCAAAARDSAVPPVEIYQVCTEMLVNNDDYQELAAKFFENCEASLEQNWPEEPWLYVLKGKAALAKGWWKRGTAFAGNTSEEQWKGFREGLAAADRFLKRAWELDPSNQDVPMYMMNLELGRGGDREQMDLWFNRAMKMNPYNYQACSLKLEYLQPKWFGSAGEMIDFGKECVASTNWMGDVPLVLADAHEILVKYLKGPDQEKYWKNPEVWKDIKASFEKFFQVNPGTPWGHERYARFAAWCEQWEEFARQVKLAPSINREYFGEVGRFEVYVQKAEAALGKNLF